MPHNLQLWTQYRNHAIDRRTLITERFLYVLRPMGFDDETYAWQINDDFIRRTATKTKIIEGAIDLLEYLSPKYRLFILSNGFREIQSQKMQNAGLAPYFERILLSEDVSIQKPNRKIFDYALKNTNSRRSESLMIGDSFEADIEGAQNAHIDQVWFNPHHEAPKDPPPTFIIHSLLELIQLL
jgi:putative hydrolase of the HAD superfamily